MTSVEQSCVICSSSPLVSYGSFARYQGEALYCKQCDTFFPSVLPTVDDVIKYYQGFNFNAVGGSRIYKWITRAQFAAKGRVIANKIKQYTTGDSVLDFGGGTGFFAEGLMKQGLNVKMYEIDESAKHIAQANGVVTIDEPTEQFDAVFSSHVIEHFIQPDQFFKQISAYLKPNGIVIVACPHKNSEEWYRKAHVQDYLTTLTQVTEADMRKNPWFCIDPPRHIYALSLSTMRVLAKANNYEVLEEFTEYSNTGNFYHNNMYSLLNIKSFIKKPGLFFFNLYITFMSNLTRLRKPMGGENMVVVLRKK
jgi:ubiquinone/menaquinone biosynthesis C-methylase UbiE